MALLRPGTPQLRARWTALLLGPIIVTVLAADVWILLTHNRSTPVSTEEAVERFRVDQPTQSATSGGAQTTVHADAEAEPGQSTDIGTSTTVSPSTVLGTTATAAGTGPEAARPAPGVYSYETQGFETFASARHDYPPTTNAVVTMSDECSWTFDHLVLEEHRDTYSMCNAADDVELVRWRFYRSFMGFTLDELYACAGATLLRATRTQGESITFHCQADDEDAVAMTVTSLERTDVVIDGRPVPAVHLRGDGEITGGPTGQLHVELWLHARTGLRLREQRSVDAELNAAVISGRYREEAEFNLQSLTPRT